MAYYRITIILENGKKYQGIKKYGVENIDSAYDIFFAQAKERFGGASRFDFDCVKMATQAIEKFQAAKGIKISDTYSIEAEDIPPG